GGDRLAGQALAAQRLDPLHDGGGVGRYRRLGRDRRSKRPAAPCCAKRTIHLRTVRGQTPTASPTAFGVCPPRTIITIRSRPIGVRRAFLCTFIRSPSWSAAASTPSASPGSDRVDNLMKPHI